ncbi:hypothetical protein ABIB51_004535 [Arthrobacter sp. UYCu712]
MSKSRKRRTSTESAQLIAAYVRENGSMPTQRTPPSGEQKRLAQALMGLRKLNRQGKLPDAAARILDDANPAWTARANYTDKSWQARADEFVAWVIQHGMPRRQATDLTERSLAEWLAEHRVHALNGRRPDRIKELNARLPGWRETPRKKNRSYSDSAQLIAAYFRENGSMPTLIPPHSGEQARLARTLSMLRTLNRQGKLPDEPRQILEEAHPGWVEGARISRERLWRARAEDLITWVTQHGRNPHWSAADSTERALASWVNRQRAHANHGRHPDRIKELNIRLPGWRRSPSSTPKPRAKPERNRPSERTKAGPAAARASGHMGGRPPVMTRNKFQTAHQLRTI